MASLCFSQSQASFLKGRRVEDPIYQLVLSVAMVKMLPGSRYTGCFRREHLDPSNMPTLCLRL